MSKGNVAKRSPVKAKRNAIAKSEVAGPAPVVAIGASAGGLEPMTAFFNAMPSNNGFAFVVIQHLDPTSKSVLAELLATHTKMRVHTAEDGVLLAPNEVYVLPPGFYATIESGRLHFTPMQIGHGIRMPIDPFLHSLAADRGNRGIGIILSGTGTDGAQGLKALKEAGGLALVENPNDAQQDGMPRYAMHIAHPDYVIPVAEMPAVLLRYIAHDYVNQPQIDPREEEPDLPADPPLISFVATLKARTGQDFAQYKPGTLERRIERRMALHAIQSRANYLKLVKDSQAETEALAKDLLINVTGFFRDERAFASLAKHLAERLRKHLSDEPIRVWAAGCSTGEEAYSLAILLLEQIAATRPHLTLQIFATDIDDDALQIARAGVYPRSALADLSAERLARFFVEEDKHFRVAKPLRDVVVFSHHDLLRDPPFSRMDIISCRNLLIYLRTDAQRRILSLLNFALANDGLLFLGSAESVNPANNLFEPLDEKSRIYRRLGVARSLRTRLSAFDGDRDPKRPTLLTPSVSSQTPSLAELVQRVILDTYAPAAVVTNRELTPLFFFGDTDRYFQVVSGEPNQDILAMAREGLRAKLRAIVTRAFRSKRRVASHGVWLEREGKHISVTIEAQRLTDEHREEVLVTFIDEVLPTSSSSHMRSQQATNSEIQRLREELAETRRELNRTFHDLRRTNEELKVKNQEAMSQNEEFVSTNEELQSSKEELQSLNEELETINNQLRQALEQQQQTSTDLSNLLNSSAVATILLDARLHIKTFNPRMKALFSLIDSDVGRPLADLVPKFSDPELLADATAARAEGKASEREIHAQSGAWYQRAALPYLTETGEIRGAVITFADVSLLKRTELDAAAARVYAETIVDAIAEPLVVLDIELKIESANAAFTAAFGVAPAQIRGRKLHVLHHPLFNDARLADRLNELVSKPQGSVEIEIDAEQPQLGYRLWRASARLFQATGMPRPMILLTLNDITDQRRILRHQLQLMLDSLPGAFLAVDEDRRIRFVSAKIESLLGYKANELIGQRTDMLLPPELRAKHAELQAAFVAHPVARPMCSGLEIYGIAKDGRRIPLDITLSPLTTAGGILVVAALHDLRMQKQSETQLREAKGEAERANQAKSRFLAAASHDLRQPLQIITLLLNLLSQRVSEAEVHTILTRLEGTVANMTELLDTLLDVNQIECGAIVPMVADLPLAALLTRAREEFAPLAAAKGLSLHVMSSSAVVRSDRHLLIRILDNLLSNAIKYTDSGKILLGCRRHGETLGIEVWDTGVGIPADRLDAVFDEFYRLDRGDNSRFGLGLGLYIVKHFAELLGHRVEVHSIQGKGTMFALILPLAGFAATAGSKEQAIESGHPLILLIEDNRVQRETLGALLESEGYRLASAGSGQEALALLRGAAAIRPDLVIADHHLSGDMTGLQLIERIRTELGPQIAALIVSGNKSQATVKMFEAAGLMFIGKPFRAADLLSAVATLTKSEVPGTPAAPRPRPALPAALPQATGSDVAIIDDEPGVREALQLALEARGLGVTTYNSAEAFLADPTPRRFRCLVIDIMLPGMDGLALQHRLKAEQLQIPIILMTGGGDLPLAVKAMREGAADFLQKPVNDTELSESVARALEARPQATSLYAEHDKVAARLATLTARERQVMERMVAGEANKNIAADLGISQRTIEHHRQSVMHKMDAKSLAMLVRMVMSHLPPGPEPTEPASNGR